MESATENHHTLYYTCSRVALGVWHDNAFVFVIAYKLSYLITARQNGGLLVPHTASLRCEAGVFLSKLILLPSTYSRSAWEVSEQVGGQAHPAL